MKSKNQTISRKENSLKNTRRTGYREKKDTDWMKKEKFINLEEEENDWIENNSDSEKEGYERVRKRKKIQMKLRRKT